MVRKEWVSMVTAPGLRECILLILTALLTEHDAQQLLLGSEKTAQVGAVRPVSNGHTVHDMRVCKSKVQLFNTIIW